MPDDDDKLPPDTRMAELNETAMSVAQLVVRVDERLQNLLSEFGRLQTKLADQGEQLNLVITRVSVGEATLGEVAEIADRVQALAGTLRDVDNRLRGVEGFDDRTADRGKRVLDAVIKIALTVVGAYLVWHLHLQPVP